MLVRSLQQGVIKEVLYSTIILSAYLFHGIGRSYLSFLFHQLDSPDSSIIVDDDEKSWMAACINLLSPLGCLIAGITMDAYGRKISLQMAFVPFFISWLIVSLAKNVSMFYVAYLVQSIGTGMSFSTSTYVSEIATVDHRGALLGTVEVIFFLGVLLCNFFMYYIKWYIVSIIFTTISGIFLMLTCALPESPTWLYLKGRQEQSINTLSSIRCQDREALKLEIDDMANHILSTRVKMKPKETFLNCLHSWRQFLIVSVLFIIIQNTGYSVMTLYIIMIVDRLNISYPSTDIALLYSITCSIGGLITPYIMYKFNRKPALAISGLGMSLSAAAVPIYLLYSISESYNQIHFPWIVPVALCSYVIFASFGVCPIGFTIAGEIFPNEVRGVMNGLYGAFAYLYWSLLYKISPWYFATFGASGVLWTFAVFSMLTALFSLFILPETKGKTLNEVQEEYFKMKR